MSVKPVFCLVIVTGECKDDYGLWSARLGLPTLCDRPVRCNKCQTKTISGSRFSYSPTLSDNVSGTRSVNRPDNGLSQFGFETKTCRSIVGSSISLPSYSLPHTRIIRFLDMVDPSTLVSLSVKIVSRLLHF